MQGQVTGVSGLVVFEPLKYEDDRGFLSETYSRAELKKAGIDVGFVQENHSFSAMAGTIRGLHFQAPPSAQAKLIRVVRGSVFDVAVDLRVGSPTYGSWEGVELSEKRWNQIFVPAGFAHGFCTLEPETHLVYKVSEPYSLQCEGGVAWDDPDLAIEWPRMERYVISEKDRALPPFSEFVSPFGLSSLPANEESPS
ncbi:MAG: dTDP-4-dehydrorhamnose 3,5-epimerase [Gemmatimonadetes bacterium]|nr:dTDP-4-dehydrorhamnose 3,5-epimerase [Gemmatimonadota bacterium]NNM06693.1 dTDP-4-dehydrorhamnose 3,5-epimerase [Gemmatimonadota bacterium]